MNDIQKELEQLKVDREVDEHNESHEFRLGYVKAMCHAINLVKNLDLCGVMPRISYAEDWEGNKYEPCEINCKLDDEGKISFETKEVFGLGDVPLDLEPEYGA